MPEHYADDYTMSLIAGTNPNPRVSARWLVPTVATPMEPETESVDAEEVDTKVVDAPKRRTRKPATAKAETA